MEEVKIETIKQPIIEIPDYSYGNGQNTLDYELALRNKPSGSSNFYIGNFTITTTGNISITGVGFKPKYIEFYYNSSVTGAGDGVMTSTAQNSYDPKTLTRINTDCVYIRDNSSNVIARCQYVSMDDDGFTINCSFRSNNLILWYRCFG